MSLLYAKVRFPIVSAQYSAVSVAVEFVMWISAVVQVWFSFGMIIWNEISAEIREFLPY